MVGDEESEGRGPSDFDIFPDSVEGSLPLRDVTGRRPMVACHIGLRRDEKRDLCKVVFLQHA